MSDRAVYLVRLLASAAICGAIVSGCSTNAEESDAEGSAVPTVSGSDASVVVQVDCGDDGVASVKVSYGGNSSDGGGVLVGRNPTTQAAGGLATFSRQYGTDVGFDDATLSVTTSPTTGTCTTTLTDYNSGEVLSQRETAGRAVVEAVVSAGH
ncbi:hypothetical protein [Rhodococcus wratislaviensis]|uniref:Lipoprotein n=1 Tax=Rhodococcus wratislaviensis NBRC 100605 TaxID=1219028 RepID=X0Q721_RHOWR|nr:hypothetical protein [Rhodococcus wratislaviensis]GAF47202.1 hypothetical protein RW1_038_01240 [Rhodococcus wratislaviensis NBRC 100605]